MYSPRTEVGLGHVPTGDYGLERVWVMTEWPLLAVLDDEQRRDLLSRSRRRRFAKGEVIFHEGDPGETLHLMAGGRVAVRLATPLGDQITLRIIGPGGWFGEFPRPARSAPRNASIVALEPAETLVLHRDQIADISERVPAFERVVADALIAEVRRLSAALLESALRAGRQAHPAPAG